MIRVPVLQQGGWAAVCGQSAGMGVHCPCTPELTVTVLSLVQVLAWARGGGPLSNLRTFSALLVYLVAPATPASTAPGRNPFLLSQGVVLGLLAKSAALAVTIHALACRPMPGWLAQVLQCELGGGSAHLCPGPACARVDGTDTFAARNLQLRHMH